MFAEPGFAQARLGEIERTPIADWLALFELLDAGIFDGDDVNGMSGALFGATKAA